MFFYFIVYLHFLLTTKNAQSKTKMLPIFMSLIVAYYYDYDDYINGYFPEDYYMYNNYPSYDNFLVSDTKGNYFDNFVENYPPPTIEEVKETLTPVVSQTKKKTTSLVDKVLKKKKTIASESVKEEKEKTTQNPKKQTSQSEKKSLSKAKKPEKQKEHGKKEKEGPQQYEKKRIDYGLIFTILGVIGLVLAGIAFCYSIFYFFYQGYKKIERKNDMDYYRSLTRPRIEPENEHERVRYAIRYG